MISAFLFFQREKGMEYQLIRKESYHEFKEIYSNYPIIENNKIQNVVTEEVSYK